MEDIYSSGSRYVVQYIYLNLAGTNRELREKRHTLIYNDKMSMEWKALWINLAKKY
jgi:hypothetical protein